MVKNTHGGSKHKSQARKHSNSNQLRVEIEPNGEFEKYAIVRKMFGNGMCQVETKEDSKTMLCHIRGKFRGKNKKNITLVVNSTVIVGLRDWESTKENCDLIAVIDSPFQSSSIMEDENNEDGFVFGNTNNVEQRDDEVAPQVIPEEMEIDIDDI